MASASSASSAARIRTLIVDDEPLARRGLRARLDRRVDVEIVGECASGRAAVDAIRTLAPDLVLLDVQMPGIDGFGVVDAVGADAMPVVVFVTAHDEHALRAFESHALDYVLKPIAAARLDQALDRAARRVAERRARAAAGGSASAAAPLDHFLVRRGSRVVVVPTDAVDWIEADGDYVRLHAGPERHLLRETMGRLETQLDRGRFVRIHRSLIVNVERIAELHPQPNREYVVVLRDGTRLKLSRSYRDRLDARLGEPR
jgi:two-component system LytT family response regulator